MHVLFWFCDEFHTLPDAPTPLPSTHAVIDACPGKRAGARPMAKGTWRFLEKSRRLSV